MSRITLMVKVHWAKMAASTTSGSPDTTSSEQH